MAWRTRRQVRSQPSQEYAEDALQELLDVMDTRMQRINEEYLRRMGTHIREIGKLWPSDVHRLQQIRRMNKNLQALEAEIGRAAGKTAREIEDVFEDIAQYDARMATRILGVSDTIRVSDNEPLRRILRAQARETARTMLNLSNTTVVSRFYRKAVDESCTAVQTGVQDYNSAIRNVIRDAGQHGLRVTDEGTTKVDYESGYSRRLDSAARMNVLDGVRHLNQSVMEEVAEQFGANGVEIDAHMLCAEDHLPYQGGQYSNEEFEQIQDSLQRPFGEWNCRHSWHGIILGVSPPTYTPEQLEEMRQYSTEEITIDGRTKTRYEWSQEMRRCEVRVRQMKDCANLARATGDELLRQRCQGQITELNKYYRELAGKAGIGAEYRRTYVAGFRDVKSEPSSRGNLAAASRMYVNENDQLFKNLKNVKPIPGFEDFGAHGKPYYIEHVTSNGQTEKYNAKQFADILKSDPEYHGGNVRLLVCNAGEKDDGFAQQLARHLGVRVMAPSETLWTRDQDGELFISNIEILAEMWYNGIDVEATGSWRIFEP